MPPAFPHFIPRPVDLCKRGCIIPSLGETHVLILLGSRGLVAFHLVLPAFPALYKDLQYCASMIRILSMRKFKVYRDHGTPANIEADEDVIEEQKGIVFKRKGKIIAKFHWENIHGWEENLAKPRSTTAKK